MSNDPTNADIHQASKTLTAAQTATGANAASVPTTSRESPIPSGYRLGLVGLFIGAAGGALKVVAIHTPLGQSLLYGALFGVIFGLFFSRRATSAGAGLIWALGFAFLAWIVFPNGAVRLIFHHTPTAMLADARERFPHLVAYILCLGTPVGLAFGIWGGLRPDTQQPKFRIGRAIVAGGLAGVVGGA